MADEIEYVTNAAWLREVGRPDHIDDVADQYERPPASSRAWPRRSPGWRAAAGWNLHPQEQRITG